MLEAKPAYRKLFRALKAPEYFTLWTYSLWRATPPVWNFFNKSGKAVFKKHPARLDELQQRLLNELENNGIASVHLDELLPGANVLSDLKEHAKLLEKDAESGDKKSFLQYYWDNNADIGLDNPFMQVSLQPRVLDIVNMYMRLCSKLILVELAKSEIMSSDAAAMGSQRWHRDPGMKRLLKMFIYLTDVDEESGPFSYLPQSHSGGHWRRLFPQKQFGRRGIYPPEGAMDKAVPKSDIKVCTGRAGTVIFCDTTGLHKGGYSTSNRRIMYTSVYAAEGDAYNFKGGQSIDLREGITTLNAVSRYAVNADPE